MTTTTLDPTASCDRILSRLARDLGEDRFDRYLRGSARLSLDGEALVVRVPTSFYADWLESRLGDAILNAAREELGATPPLRWAVDPDTFGRDGRAAGAGARTAVRSGHEPRPGAIEHAPAPTPRPRRHASGAPGALRHRLDEFIVGPSNRLAFEAAHRLADPASSPGFSCLFLHGECGVGKTHLLQGLAAHFAERHPRAKVRCLTGEAFTNEYIAGVRAGRIAAFRESLRRLDLLCLDDAHFIAGKEATQSEFMHTFDALDLSGARVALASDGHPRQIAHFSARLASRCMSGLVVEMQRPDRATRARLAAAMAARRGLRLDAGAAEAVADRCAGSARDIEGAVMRLDAMRRLVGDAAAPGVTPAFVARALAPADDGPPRRPVRVQRIAEVVAGELRVELGELLGGSRHQRVVLARSLAAYLARRLTSQSFPEIARALGRPNHSTIVTACQRIEGRIARGEPATGAGIEQEPLGLAELCERLRQAVLRTA